MNKLSRLHDALAIISVGAPLTGLLAKDGAAHTEHYLMCVVLMLLRVKFWIDDIEFFEDRAKHRGLRFQLGLLLGVLSWISFTIAGLMILSLPQAASFAAAGMGLSALWLLIAMTEKDGYREQALFLGFNLFYVLGFLCMALGGDANAIWAGLVVVTIALLVDLMASNFVGRLAQ